MKEAWLKELLNEKFCIDSRAVTHGCIFVAINGEHHDGHDFAKEALKKGAKAAVVERSLGLENEIVVENTVEFLLKSASMKLSADVIVGVTGSSGKTFTKQLLKRLIPGCFANPGNMNTEIGLPLSILNEYNGEKIAVLEMGMDKRGDIKRLCHYFPPKIGVVLNVGRQHIGKVGSQQELFYGKMEMFDSADIAVYNADDERMEEYLKEKPKIGFGMQKGDIRLKDWKYESFKTVAIYETPQGEVLLKLPSIWHRGHLLDLAAAMATLQALDMEFNPLKLQGMEFMEGRFKTHILGEIVVIDDTYNASLQAFEAAIQAMEKLPARRRIAAVGPILEQGEFSKDTHEKLSRALERLDGVFVLDGFEGSQYINPSNVIERSEDPSKLAKKLVKFADSGDIILFKASRGVRMERVLHAFRRILGW